MASVHLKVLFHHEDHGVFDLFIMFFSGLRGEKDAYGRIS